MTDNSKGLHEENLSAEVIDRHRAIVSVMEELEAADWYAQRAEAATDDDLRAILEHNGNEEKEHASMLLEWLRRKDSALAAHFDTYLYHQGSIIEAEAEADAADSSQASGNKHSSTGDGSLGIGSLKSKQP